MIFVFEVAFLFHLIMFNVMFWPCVKSVSHQISWQYVLISCVCHYHWFDVLDLQATSYYFKILWAIDQHRIYELQYQVPNGKTWAVIDIIVKTLSCLWWINMCWIKSKRHWLFHDDLHLTITLDNQCQNEVEIRGLKYNLIFLCN